MLASYSLVLAACDDRPLTKLASTLEAAALLPSGPREAAGAVFQELGDVLLQEARGGQGCPETAARRRLRLRMRRSTGALLARWPAAADREAAGAPRAVVALRAFEQHALAGKVSPHKHTNPQFSTARRWVGALLVTHT